MPGSSATSAGAHQTFASLAHGNFRKFFAAQTVSATGTWMQSVALAWLVLQLTRSPTWLGFAVALQFLPVLLFSAVTLNSVMANATRAIGPALAGILIATVSLGLCFVINALSFGVVIIALLALDGSKLRICHPTRPSVPPQHRDGLHGGLQNS